MNLDDATDRRFATLLASPNLRETVLRQMKAVTFNHQHIEDALQDAYLKAWEARRTFDRPLNERNMFVWFRMIVVNQLRDHFRSSKLFWKRYTKYLREPGVRITFPRQEQYTEFFICKRKARATCSPLDYAVCLLSFEEWTPSEIAENLDMSPSRAYQRLKRARKRMVA